MKPAPNTPLTTLWAVHLIRQALSEHEASPAAVQLVTGGIDVGQTLVADPRAAVVSFTGSAAVGHQIAKNAAPRKTVLELGSNTGFIVAKDARIDEAVDAVIRGGFYANGQACISVQRVIVEEQVAEEFQRRLLERMDEVAVGDPEVAGHPGGTADQCGLHRTDHDLDSGGGGLRCTDSAWRRTARSQPGPTVISQLPTEANLWCEEIFGPVICLNRVPDLDTAIELVNDSRYGLQAAIYTASLKTAFRAIEELDVGGVVVNEIPGFRSDIMPYGGVKDSGIGREGPRFAMEEFTVTRMAIIRP